MIRNTYNAIQRTVMEAAQSSPITSNSPSNSSSFIANLRHVINSHAPCLGFNPLSANADIRACAGTVNSSLNQYYRRADALLDRELNAENILTRFQIKEEHNNQLMSQLKKVSCNKDIRYIRLAKTDMGFEVKAQDKGLYHYGKLLFSSSYKASLKEADAQFGTRDLNKAMENQIMNQMHVRLNILQINKKIDCIDEEKKQLSGYIKELKLLKHQLAEFHKSALLGAATPSLADPYGANPHEPITKTQQLAFNYLCSSKDSYQRINHALRSDKPLMLDPRKIEGELTHRYGDNYTPNDMNQGEVRNIMASLATSKSRLISAMQRLYYSAAAQNNDRQVTFRGQNISHVGAQQLQDCLKSGKLISPMALFSSDKEEAVAQNFMTETHNVEPLLVEIHGQTAHPMRTPYGVLDQSEYAYMPESRFKVSAIHHSTDGYKLHLTEILPSDPIYNQKEAVIMPR